MIAVAVTYAWDRSFSVNEHAYCDLKAIVAFVHEKKHLELLGHSCSPTREPEAEIPFTLSLMAHSVSCMGANSLGVLHAFSAPEQMGAAASLMYIIKMLEDGCAHGFDSAVLLSPAGYHEEVSDVACLVISI